MRTHTREYLKGGNFYVVDLLRRFTDAAYQYFEVPYFFARTTTNSASLRDVFPVGPGAAIDQHRLTC